MQADMKGNAMLNLNFQSIDDLTAQRYIFATAHDDNSSLVT